MHSFLCKKSIYVRAIPSKKGKGSVVLKMFLYGGLKIFKNISVGGSQIQYFRIRAGIEANVSYGGSRKSRRPSRK